MFQSRWGFHPCDYQTFRKLKLLIQVYLQTVRLAHAWQRWKRKDPHNRVMRRRIRNDKGQTIGYEPPVPMPEPKICPVFSQKVFEKRKQRFLQGTYRQGKPVAAYLYLPCKADDHSGRTEKFRAGPLLDFAPDGRPIGLEITAPRKSPWLSLIRRWRVCTRNWSRPASWLPCWPPDFSS